MLPGNKRVYQLRGLGHKAPDHAGSSGQIGPRADSFQSSAAHQVDDLGRIILVGAYSSNGAYRPLVVRMTATGAADSGFGAGSGSVTIPASSRRC